MNVTTADTAAMDPIVYALNHQRVQDAELAREMADGHSEALAAREALAICASIPIDGRPAAVTELLEAAELLTDEREHLAAVRAAREVYDEFASYSQLRLWVERHDLRSGRPEHVRPAIERDHAEALAAELASIQDDLNALDTKILKLESRTLGDPGTPGRRY